MNKFYLIVGIFVVLAVSKQLMKFTVPDAPPPNQMVFTEKDQSQKLWSFAKEKIGPCHDEETLVAAVTQYAAKLTKAEKKALGEGQNDMLAWVYLTYELNGLEAPAKEEVFMILSKSICGKTGAEVAALGKAMLGDLKR